MDTAVTLTNTSHHTDTSWRRFFFDNVAPELGKHTSSSGEELLPIPAQLVDELNEDIAGLANALTACGVNVLRPAAPGKDVDHAKFLVEEKGAHYIAVLKDNHPSLHALSVSR
ncbi:hypothetical protein [Streptomyces sp. CA-106131]|uniref:hypothetical protein n=1 Tax=Streptomyces sp. CA-106131 TaxID=3240045 RepID=UPI003D8B4C28